MRLGFFLALGGSQSADEVLPALVSAVIPAAGLTLVLAYNEPLDTGSTPATGDFALAGAGSSTVSGVSVSGSAVTLTLSTAVGVGVSGITISYTPGTNKIQDAAGNDAAALVTQAVTNNSTQDITAPVLSTAVVPSSGVSLVLTYGEALDTGSTPATGDFALGGTSATVSVVNVSGSAVTLTLSGTIIDTDTITVSYTAGTNKIQDVAGNDAANLVTQAVTNNSTQTGDVTAPTLVTAAIPSAGTTLVLTYDETLDAGSTPAAGAYSLAGTARTVSSVGISGMAVTLTLSGAVAQGATVTVSYTAGGAPVQDAIGNDSANLTNQAVTNNSTDDQTAPTRTSIATNTAGTKVIVTYNETLDAGSVPALGAFALAGPVLSVLTGTPAIVGATVELDVAPAINTADSGMTLSYTAGGAPVQDSAGNDAANFSTQAVTNSSTHAYDPRDEGDAVLWIDLNDASNYTESAGMITSIKNKISNTDIPAMAIGAPYEATGLNSKPCIHPTSSTHGLSSTEAAVLTVGTNAHAYTTAWFGAYDTADPSARQTYFSFGRADNANGAKLWGHNATGGGRQCFVSVTDAAATDTSASGSDNSLTSGHTVVWRSPGTTQDCKVNDAAPDPNDDANDPGTSTPAKFTFNMRNGLAVAETFVGKTSEFWLFSTEKGDAACTRIKVYLATKWA